MDWTFLNGRVIGRLCLHKDGSFPSCVVNVDRSRPLHLVFIGRVASARWSLVAFHHIPFTNGQGEGNSGSRMEIHGQLT